MSQPITYFNYNDYMPFIKYHNYIYEKNNININSISNDLQNILSDIGVKILYIRPLGLSYNNIFTGDITITYSKYYYDHYQSFDYKIDNINIEQNNLIDYSINKLIIYVSNH